MGRVAYSSGPEVRRTLNYFTITACTRKGLRQVARQDALRLGSSKTEVEASTLSVSYTVTVGRYHYKYEKCSHTVGYI